MSVLIEKNGAVTTVILNRPEVRNAVNLQTARELLEAFDDFEADDAARWLYGQSCHSDLHKY